MYESDARAGVPVDFRQQQFFCRESARFVHPCGWLSGALAQRTGPPERLRIGHFPCKERPI
jgi:hypothetical protein